MKNILTVFSFFFCVSCASSKDTNYTASTPAAPLVRNFLGIPLADSVDFIRWNLSLNDKEYKLQCNYGIGKPNTNGFMNGGEKLLLTGSVKLENNVYTLQNGNQSLKLVILNSNLLHIKDANDKLLPGNGGWSYALNNLKPVGTGEVQIKPVLPILKDSIAYEGRTPCAVPGFDRDGCYKLKWLVVFYADAKTNQPTTYRMLTANWRQDGGRKGNWKITTKEDGRIFYQLNDENGNLLINLLKLDDGVLIFTDTKENLLVGDLDFSYTLNKRF